MAIEGLAYVLTAPGRALVAERRTWPSPAEGEALVEVIGCGLCHTDLGYARGQVPTRKPPARTESPGFSAEESLNTAE